MHEQYGEEAVSAYIEKLKNSTRFELGNVKVNDVRVHEVKPVFLTALALSIDFEQQEIKGKKSLSSEDIAVYDDNDKFLATVEAAMKQEHSREKSIDECAEYYAHLSFATCKSKQIFRTHPSEFLHIRTCHHCNGEREITCTACGGEGERICPSCGGGKQERCSRCGGSGWQKVNASTAILTDKTHEKCDKCYGSGVTRCSQCDGRGRIRCSTCGGRGRISCPTCNGTGYLTTSVRVHTYVTPTYSAFYPDGSEPYFKELVEEKIGLFNFLEHGEAKLEKIDKQYENRGVVLAYVANIMVCEMDIEIDDLKATAIVFGKQHALFDSGGIVGELLREDLDALSKTTEDQSLFSFQRMKNARKSLSEFMESEVHQEMLDEHNKGMSSDQVHENIGRSLNKDYIDYAILNLRHLIDGIVTRMGIESAVASLFMAVLGVSLAYTLYNPDHWDPLRIDDLHLLPTSITILLLLASALPYMIGVTAFHLWAKKAGKERLLFFAKKVLVKTMAISASISLVGSVLINSLTYDVVFEAAKQRYDQRLTDQAERMNDEGEESEVETLDLQTQQVPQSTSGQAPAVHQNPSSESAYLSFEKELIFTKERCFRGDQSGCDEWDNLWQKKADAAMQNTKPAFMNASDEDTKLQKKFYEDECMTNNSAVACYEAGAAFRYGMLDGVFDNQKALQYFKKACEEGHQSGCQDYNVFKKTGK